MSIVLSPPSRGPVTQWFAENPNPDYQPGGHTANDYAYSDGEQTFPDAFAMDAGTVVWADDSRKLGWPNPWYFNPDFDRSDDVDESAGNVIVIDHGYGVTTYGHLEDFDVVPGQYVERGQRIGTVGNTGRSYGKHLHAELILQPFNFNTPTYGRANLNLYMEMELDMTPEELLNFPAFTGGPTVSSVLKEVHEVYNGMFKGGPSTPYRASLFSLVDDVPRRSSNAVAGYPVTRGGNVTTWLQDSADGTSLGWSLQRAVLPAMAESLKVDPEIIRAAFEDAVKGASVTVTIGSDEKDK